jgi:uncharacterized protein (TIGR04222 family)
MDWTAPYLIVSLAALAIVELWFVSALVVLGRRYRAKRRNVSGRGPLLRVAELSSEELGLLAGGEQRWSEVALLRLCLEGHVKEDGLIVLVDDPGSANPERWPRTVRDAILERLRGRRPAHLQDVVYAGRKHGESSVPYGRLAKLGLVDDGAVGVARTRQRVMNWYLGLFTTTFIVAVICLSLAATDVRAAVAIGIGLMAVCMAVAALMSRTSGARFEVITGDGRELIARAALEHPEPADDRLLHRVAL